MSAPLKPCPKCGRPMAEETQFPGLWTCPGYKVRLNDKAPFRFECTGMELTEAGAEAFADEVMRVWTEKHVKLN